MPLRVAVDAMGGDHGPSVIVRGALRAAADSPALFLSLVGDTSAIEDALRCCDTGAVAERVEIIHTDSVIGMQEGAIEGLRRAPDSSVARLVELAALGRADAIISAGHTGAFVAACQLRLGRLAGVNRPGVAVTIPAPHGVCVLCDAGANIQAKPVHLYEYAVMASVYAETQLSISRPRVALMSIGEESVKGTGLVKEAHALLAADASLAFVGNVEGQELFEDRCDVVICDGFVGNVVLKLAEGLADGLRRTITTELASLDAGTKSLLRAGLERVWNRHDYSRYGGAPLLGVNGACMICHGRSNGQAIANAVRAARRFDETDVNRAIEARLTRPRGESIRKEIVE